MHNWPKRAMKSTQLGKMLFWWNQITCHHCENSNYYSLRYFEPSDLKWINIHYYRTFLNKGKNSASTNYQFTESSSNNSLKQRVEWTWCQFGRILRNTLVRVFSTLKQRPWLFSTHLKKCKLSQQKHDFTTHRMITSSYMLTLH